VPAPHVPRIHSFSLITGSTQTNCRCPWMYDFTAKFSFHDHVHFLLERSLSLRDTSGAPGADRCCFWCPHGASTHVPAWAGGPQDVPAWYSAMAAVDRRSTTHIQRFWILLSPLLQRALVIRGCSGRRPVVPCWPCPPPLGLGSRLRSFLRDYDALQSLAVALIYLQV
jgi:hypothetical protein